MESSTTSSPDFRELILAAGILCLLTVSTQRSPLLMRPPFSIRRRGSTKYTH